MGRKLLGGFSRNVAHYTEKGTKAQVKHFTEGRCVTNPAPAQRQWADRRAATCGLEASGKVAQAHPGRVPRIYRKVATRCRASPSRRRQLHSRSACGKSTQTKSSRVCVAGSPSGRVRN